MMNDNLIRNTIAQLAFCYSANRRRESPVQYSVTGMKGRTLQLFQQVEGTSNWDVHVHEGDLEQVFDPEHIVYLTSDSENVLDRLDDGDVYVIGGLLDHNQHPGASLARATALGCRHAKLPIGEFIKMNSRKVGLFMTALVDSSGVDHQPRLRNSAPLPRNKQLGRGVLQGDPEEERRAEEGRRVGKRC